MKILDRLPYHDKPTLLSFRDEVIEIRGFQIVVWLRMREQIFPAVLDTGHSHNMSIPEQYLSAWAGVGNLTLLGEIEANRRLLPQYAADVWIHKNRPKTREPLQAAFPLRMDQGITVVPEGTTGAPRLPLLGLRAISKSGLNLIIDGRHRLVSLTTGRW